jgi:hypothetical protein
MLQNAGNVQFWQEHTGGPVFRALLILPPTCSQGSVNQLMVPLSVCHWNYLTGSEEHGPRAPSLHQWSHIDGQETHRSHSVHSWPGESNKHQVWETSTKWQAHPGLRGRISGAWGLSRTGSSPNHPRPLCRHLLPITTFEHTLFSIWIASAHLHWAENFRTLPQAEPKLLPVL